MTQPEDSQSEFKVEVGDVLIHQGPKGFQVLLTLNSVEVVADEIPDREAAVKIAKEQFPQARILHLS